MITPQTEPDEPRYRIRLPPWEYVSVQMPRPVEVVRNQSIVSIPLHAIAGREQINGRAVFNKSRQSMNSEQERGTFCRDR
jgi:hypothetical protein